MRLAIRGGRVLLGDRLQNVDLVICQDGEAGHIEAIDGRTGCERSIDASGLLVLPGIVDIHGDAFERQIEPRPGVGFALDMALLETDRQLAGNGITTAYHGVTWSWEPGLRSSANARALLAAMERLKPVLAVDTRYHLRHETYNLDAEAEIIGWLAAQRIGCLAFNDHMTGTIKDRHRPEKLEGMIKRSGIAAAAFQTLVDRVYDRRNEVPGSMSRLAAAALAAGVPMLSHDDRDVETRDWFRQRGVTISEFPVTDAVADAACATGDATVFGAPNIIRGGSHTGCPSATEMVARGHCTILASDYYYPALLHAPFKLAELGVAPLAEAWQLVCANPARALGLLDRGTIAIGRRADVILVDDATKGTVRVMTTIANGRIAYLAGGDRLTTGVTARRPRRTS